MRSFLAVVVLATLSAFTLAGPAPQDDGLACAGLCQTLCQAQNQCGACNDDEQCVCDPKTDISECSA
ncbi:hypothetical protein BDW74DRAFT_175649 [Aspergillus multicolor]|uniref:uncharacterized protein n=1 Tax=Aspergillus multicolor TaxID=41759 RepID=UPI003CCD0AAC